MSIFGTGFGQSNQQQQQQQPQQNAFGQPSAFGTSGFGAFGQTQQQQQQQQPQQQPQANPMFGNLATTSSNPSGGFGASHPQANAGSAPPYTQPAGAFGGGANNTSAFGQPKAAFGSTGGGTGAFGSSQPTAFGSTSGGGAFGNAGTSGGAFGASASGSGAFGQPAVQQQQSNAFGGGGSGLFGKPAGASSFGGGNALAPSLPTAGSSNPPYQDTQERDTSAGGLSTMLHYQSISCMPAYRNASFEELRVQDYQQGRKTANAFGAAAPSAFGQPTQQQPNGGGLFGQPSASNALGAFGQQPQQPQQPQPSAGGFGAFGQQPQQPQQSSAFGAFGQTPQQQQPAAGGFGAFGQQQQPQQQNPSPFGAFGQQQQQQQQPQQSSPFGAFGQQNQQNKGFGAFAQSQPSTTAFSAFSNNAGNNTGSSLFGQQQQPQQQNPSPFGAFGQQNNQQNQQNLLLKPSVFGQPSTGGSGLFGNAGQQQQPGGLFGQQAGQQQQPQQQGSGIFGQPSGGGTGAFGQPVQPAQQNTLFGQTPSTGGGGLFGNANQQQGQQQPQQNQQAGGAGFSSLFSKPAGGGLFGSTPTPQNQNQTQQPQNPNPANPLFGGGGGLFGSTPQQGQQTNPNPLFGGGGLFGGKAPAPSSGIGGGGGGLFGSINQQQQQPSLGGGLFGSATGTQQQSQQSMFGGSQHPQPNLTASIDQPLPSSTTSLPPLPSLAASLNSPKKKSNVFADVAARSSPRLGLGLGGGGLNYAPPGPGSKLRGFGGSTSTMTIAKNPFALPPPGGSPGKNGGSLLSPDAFGGGTNGMLGGARQSVKKLVLDKRVDEEELHRMRGGTTTPGATAREVRFSPALGVASREREHESAPSPSPARSATASSNAPPRPSSRLNDVSNVSPPHITKDSNAPLDPQEGEYWCLPTVTQLQLLPFSALQTVKDFTVGRVGYGTIQFLQPVDLTAVPSIADIPGKIVTFEHVECMLYPDERLKPPAGEGLNVPARIKLDQCWAVDKSTREPIKDENNPKHIQRLKKMKAHDGAEFVSFDMETGVWEFIVQEF